MYFIVWYPNYYLFKTSDYGANWTLITNGIEDKEITRVIREDPDRKGLIFAGTETGVYVSFDDGAQWQRLQLNLPHVPVWDMRITHNDIQIATHGRGFWIFDDLHILEQQDDKVSNAKVHLFKPTSTTRFKTFSARHPRNPPSGVVIHYLLNQPAKKSIELLFTDERRNLVKRFSVSIDDSGDVVLPETKAESGMRGTSRSRRRSDALTNNKGLNRIVWNFRYPNAKKVPNAVTQASQEVGPHAPPGTYQVELVVDGIAQHTDFVLLKDPRVEATNQDLEEQFHFLSDMRDKIEEVNVTILAVRKLRAALEATDSTGGDLAARAEHIAAELWAVEDDLIQHKATFTRFLHANPVMLNEKLYQVAGFVANADARPTQAQRDLFAEFSARADRLTERFRTLVRQDVPAYNRSAGDKLLPTDLGPAD